MATTKEQTIYSCYRPASVRTAAHYVETEFYGEACLYHKLWYSVVKWPKGNKPCIEGHKFLLAQCEGQTNFQPNS